MRFSQDENGVSDEGYISAPDPFKVEGECQDCGHRWTVRGARQIWDIPGHPAYEPPGSSAASKAGRLP